MENAIGSMKTFTRILQGANWRYNLGLFTHRVYCTTTNSALEGYDTMLMEYSFMCHWIVWTKVHSASSSDRPFLFLLLAVPTPVPYASRFPRDFSPLQLTSRSMQAFCYAVQQHLRAPSPPLPALLSPASQLRASSHISVLAIFCGESEIMLWADPGRELIDLNADVLCRMVSMRSTTSAVQYRGRSS